MHNAHYSSMTCLYLIYDVATRVTPAVSGVRYTQSSEVGEVAA